MANTLMRTSPFRTLERMTKDVDRLWDSFFEEHPVRSEELWGGLHPSIDLSETPDEFIVKAEIPGTDPKNIDISLNDGMMTIKGEKRQEKEEKKENYHFVERSYGAFTRSVPLPGEVQREKVKASYKDGVLKVILPKSEEARKKEIKVKVD
jgi:HSP20 family protein